MFYPALLLAVIGVAWVGDALLLNSCIAYSIPALLLLISKIKIFSIPCMLSMGAMLRSSNAGVVGGVD